MNPNILSAFGFGPIPPGVPPALAISIAVNGLTENEARQIMVKGGDRDRADDWIKALRDAGYFGFPSPSPSPSPAEAFGSAAMPNSAKDAGTLLWQSIKRELQNDEDQFKLRTAALDSAVKGMGLVNDLTLLCRYKARDLIPPMVSEHEYRDHFPWHGCKFAAMAVMHMVSPHDDVHAKQEAVRPVSKSLGGFVLPSPKVLATTRWPYELSDAIAEAKEASLSSPEPTPTAILVTVSDVEIMRNPSKSLFVGRPGTFAHSFVLTVSPAGIYLYQGYGPQGYTLLQHMRNSDASYPLSFSEVDDWVRRFEIFAACPDGVWTEDVNSAYKDCFNVDLVKIGSMKIGSQLDVLVKCYSIPFDSCTVKRNFAQLPIPDTKGKKTTCSDGTKCKQPAVGKHSPDGGVKHYYVPLVLRCGHCGRYEDGAMKRCSICRKSYYCSKEHQVLDWKARHKKVCKSLAEKTGQQV